MVRVALLIGIVWGSPLTIMAMMRLVAGGYGAAALGLFFGFVALCHMAGRWVGRFEKDTPLQYAVGCSWPYWLGGGLGVALGWVPAAVLLPGAVLLAVSGWTGARRAVGRRTELIAKGQCLFCEYDLAGLGATGTCPECGQKFDRAPAEGAAEH